MNLDFFELGSGLRMVTNPIALEECDNNTIRSTVDADQGMSTIQLTVTYSIS